MGASHTRVGMALKAMMETSGTPGTVRVYGCAAEEAYGGKTYLAPDGRFNDLDAAIAWHPADFAAAGNIFMTAVRGLGLAFKGQSAHAAQEPWDGRDAAELAAHALNQMREHVRPTARIHDIFKDGGLVPNLVPDTAALLVFLREQNAASVQAMTDWALETAEGAALSTQTEANPVVMGDTANLFPNEPLSRRYLQCMNEVGLTWTDDEQEFARACQREGGVANTGLPPVIQPYDGDVEVGGSSDVGDVARNAPAALFLWPTHSEGAPLHSWPVTAAGGISIGDKAAMDTAAIMAASGFDVMTDAGFRASLRAEYEMRIAGKEYVNGVPPGQAGPIDVPVEILKVGDDDEVDGFT